MEGYLQKLPKRRTFQVCVTTKSVNVLQVRIHSSLPNLLPATQTNKWYAIFWATKYTMFQTEYSLKFSEESATDIILRWMIPVNVSLQFTTVRQQT
jgi:hypothetical protein